MKPLGCRDYPCMTGGLAQLGEHLLCKQGVVGSIPISSTTTEDRSQKAELSERREARFFILCPLTPDF